MEILRNKPLVTTIIVTYQYGHFIEEAIESVLNQDFPKEDMEIIVVDDGSTDDTEERIKKYKDKIKYIYKENGGQASALNVGFENAKGEIICTLDADDYWLPQKIRKVVLEFEKDPEVGYVYHPFILYYTETKKIEKQEFTPTSGWIFEDKIKVLKYLGMATSGCAFRKRFLNRLLPIPSNLKIAADGYLVGLIPFIFKVLALNEHLTVYRFHKKNLFNILGYDLERLKKKQESLKILLESEKQWLIKEGYNLDTPLIKTYLSRHQLDVYLGEMTFKPPKNIEFFRFLLRYSKIYQPLWRGRYRIFKLMQILSGLLVGYKIFNLFKKIYAKNYFFKKMRKILIPRKF